MKTADADIIIIPGYTNSDDDHWQSRWQRQFRTARRVEQEDWHKPVVEDWADNVVAEMEKSTRPIVVVAHSLGCQAFMQAVPKLRREIRDAIKGAFLVAPPDVENPDIRPRHLMTFGPYPRDPLPFPSIVIASTNDSFCHPEIAGDMANAWGSLFIEAGESGHLNSKSGHGPWPEGLLVFGEFMKKLK